MFRKNHVMRFFTVMTLVIAMFVGLLVPCCQKAEAAAYTVSFNGRGGYVKSGRPHAYESSFITTPETRPYKAPEYFFQKTGYEQIGWTTRSANTTVVDYTEGQTISLTSNITLYPIYKVKQYTITCINGTSG